MTGAMKNEDACVSRVVLATVHMMKLDADEGNKQLLLLLASRKEQPASYRLLTISSTCKKKLTMKLSTALPFLLSVAASPVFVSSSKSSKSNADCPPPTQEVSCGDVYESGEVITLGGDVLCEGNITEAVGIPNAGITVRGEGTVIDCNGFSIRQKTDSSAAALDCKVWPVRDATQILLMKETCDLYYMWGIIVENGATAKNCNVQQFWGGASIKDGGTVLNSDFSLNFRGIEVENENDNTQSNVKSRYVKSCVVYCVFVCCLVC